RANSITNKILLKKFTFTSTSAHKKNDLLITHDHLETCTKQLEPSISSPQPSPTGERACILHWRLDTLDYPGR
ncbi:MAG: hypothetical protein WCO84_07500, partial [bacterium]